MVTVALPHDGGSQEFVLPAGWCVERVAPLPRPDTPSLEPAIRDALAAPRDGPRLPELVRAGARVTIAVTDATRPSPDGVVLPLLLQELATAGVRDADITLLVALGMHRRMTPGEVRAKLGPVAERIRVEEAQGAESAQYQALGTIDVPGAPAAVPVCLHHLVLDCDLLLATGVVEPHHYAGYSGGRKTVAVGCAGEPTIRALHGVPFLEAEGTRLGRLDGNPFHAVLEAIAARAGLRFVINVAFDAEGSLVGVAAGRPESVLSHLVGRLDPVTWARVGSRPFDVVLGGIPPSKAQSLYQASRAFTTVALSPAPVLRPGGWVVIPAQCPEGAGQGPGEREFLACLTASDNPQDTLARLRRQGFGAGGQRAFLVAKSLCAYRGLVVGTAFPDVARACGFETARGAEEAVARLVGEVGARARVLVVPQALAIIPVLDAPR